MQTDDSDPPSAARERPGEAAGGSLRDRDIQIETMIRVIGYAVRGEMRLIYGGEEIDG